MDEAQHHDDAPVETAVLYRVLDLHPARLSRAELARHMGCKNAGLHAERETVDAAIDSLVSAGLLHPPGDGFVTATRAAIHLAELFPPAP
jgi:hypothetical protein